MGNEPRFKYGRGYITDYYLPDGVFNELGFIEVRVGLRQLRATWTPELALDVQAFHNIDAEAELTRLLSDEIFCGMGIPYHMLNDFRPQRGIVNRYKRKFKYGK